MEKNLKISPLKIIIIFFILLMIIYFLLVLRKGRDKQNLIGMKEENKVVYRDDKLPIVDVDPNGVYEPFTIDFENNNSMEEFVNSINDDNTTADIPETQQIPIVSNSVNIENSKLLENID